MAKVAFVAKTKDICLGISCFFIIIFAIFTCHWLWYQRSPLKDYFYNDFLFAFLYGPSSLPLCNDLLLLTKRKKEAMCRNCGWWLYNCCQAGYRREREKPIVIVTRHCAGDIVKVIIAILKWLNDAASNISNEWHSGRDRQSFRWRTFFFLLNIDVWLEQWAAVTWYARKLV